MRSTIIAAVLLGSLTAAGAEPAATVFKRGPNSCGTPMIDELAPRARPEPTLAAGTQRVIWLNRFGQTVQLAAGQGDATMGIASRNVYLGGNAPTSVQIPAMSGQFNWPTILACVKQHYQPFNVRIVESKPTTGIYVEDVVGGDGTEVGASLSSGLLGIAGTTSVCSVNEKGIAFAFSEAHRSIPQKDAELCATIAHEVGHLLALEHEILDIDLMSYDLVSQTASKAFVDQDSRCMNQGALADCVCTRDTNMTNSGQRLKTFIGPRQMENVKPTLSVDSPDNSDTVAPSFTLTATASDDKAMADVRVLGNTALYQNVELGNAQQQTDGKWKVVVDGLLIGQQTLTVIARDEAGNETMQTLNVTVKKAAIGEDCTSNGACEGNLCAQIDDDKFCTQSCNAQNACPSGFSCSDDSAVCIPDGGGCCQTAGPNDAISGLFILGLGLVVARRRKRR